MQHWSCAGMLMGKEMNMGSTTTRKALLIGGPLDGQVQDLQWPERCRRVEFPTVGKVRSESFPSVDYERVGSFSDGTLILRYVREHNGERVTVGNGDAGAML